jgi:UDP-glucuronate decarboxylase
MHPRDGRVVSNFVMSALHGEPLTIYGDGTQTRSFCYVDDLVDGLVQMMGTPHAVTGPVNLGNPGEFTIEELADLVIELTGTASPVERLPLPADDPVRRQPDITLAKKILGWQPTVELREGLLRTIDYFRSSESAFMAPAIAAARRD